jgi:hypothetical protein
MQYAIKIIIRLVVRYSLWKSGNSKVRMLQWPFLHSNFISQAHEAKRKTLKSMLPSDEHFTFPRHTSG